MPAQPPFLIPTRSPATGLPAASISSRTRAAAASVKVITCRRNSRDAISNLHRPGSRPGGCLTYSIAPSVLTEPPSWAARGSNPPQFAASGLRARRKHGFPAPRQDHQAPPHHARLGGEALRTGGRDHPRRYGDVRLQLVVAAIGLRRLS